MFHSYTQNNPDDCPEVWSSEKRNSKVKTNVVTSHVLVFQPEWRMTLVASAT